MKGTVGQVILTARRPRADDKSGQQGEKRGEGAITRSAKRYLGRWIGGYPGSIGSCDAIPILLDKDFWGWGGTSIMEIDAPGSEMFNFLDSRHHEKRSLESKFHGKTSIGKVE